MTGRLHPGIVPVGVVALLCALAAACGGEQTPASPPPVTAPASPPPVTAPATPSPAVTAPLSAATNGLRVVSVVPPAGATGPWVGGQVHVAYLPATARVDPARCRLYVNGERLRVPARVVFIAPVNPIIVFSWRQPFPPGTYRFRAEVDTVGGASATFSWEYDYRTNRSR